MKKLHIGFIIDGKNISGSALDWIQAVRDDAELFAPPVLISQQDDGLESSIAQRVFKKLRKGEWLDIIRIFFITRIIQKIELKKIASHQKAVHIKTSYSAVGLALEILPIKPIKSKSGFVHRFSEQDIKRVKDKNFDVLIRCGSGILRGEILHAAPFGILSIHAADNRFLRGGPGGFWEVFLNEPSTGFIIQRLTDVLDGGDVICRGNIMSEPYWFWNEMKLLQKSNIFMIKALKNLAQTRHLPEIEAPVSYDKGIFKSPRLWQILSYMLINYMRALKIKILLRLGYQKRWSVSFLQQSGLNPPFSQAHRIENPKGRFLADPFVVEHEGKNICFVEDFFYQDNKGKISAYELQGDDYQPLGVVLEEDFHLSFPYIFQYQGVCYMIPESQANQDIRLYRAENFPLQWRLEKIIMSDVQAVDSMVFAHQDTYYLLSNICSASIGECNSELHIFYADNPLTDAWIPLDSNPVIFDSMRARNGGFFQHQGKKYRVSQGHGKDHYGKFFRINEIKKLNGQEYAEEEIARIDADFFKGIISTHHCHMNAHYTVFDHCRIEKVK